MHWSRQIDWSIFTAGYVGEHAELCRRLLWQFCGNSLHKLPQIGPNRTFRETRPASLLTRDNGIEFNYLDGQ